MWNTKGTWHDAGVIAMDDVIDAVLGQQLVQERGRQVIGHPCVSTSEPGLSRPFQGCLIMCQYHYAPMTYLLVFISSDGA